MRREVFLVLVVAMSLVACRADEDPNVNPTETPLENVDDCSEASAAEGAPAGITMSDTFFEPSCVAISSTQAITLANAGNLEHNFTVANGDIDIDVEPGEEETTDEIGTDLAAGTYRFFCKYHEDQGMVGTLVVE